MKKNKWIVCRTARTADYIFGFLFQYLRYSLRIQFFLYRDLFAFWLKMLDIRGQQSSKMLPEKWWSSPIFIFFHFLWLLTGGVDLNSVWFVLYEDSFIRSLFIDDDYMSRMMMIKKIWCAYSVRAWIQKKKIYSVKTLVSDWKGSSSTAVVVVVIIIILPLAENSGNFI